MPMPKFGKLLAQVKAATGGTYDDLRTGYHTAGDPSYAQGANMASRIGAGGGRAITQATDMAKGIAPMAVGIGSGLGAGAIAGGVAGNVMGQGQGMAHAQDEQMGMEQQQQQEMMGAMMQELGKKSIFDPSTGANSVTPKDIDAAYAMVAGTANAPQLTPGDYIAIAQAGGMQLELGR